MDKDDEMSGLAVVGVVVVGGVAVVVVVVEGGGVEKLVSSSFNSYSPYSLAMSPTAIN